MLGKEKMMIFRGMIVIAIIFAFTNAAFAEVPFPEACTTYYPKRQAALKAKDWNALETAAVKFIEGCGEAYSKEGLADAYMELSLVYRNKKDPKNAAEFADRAIFNSKEPKPHIEKAIVFVQLNRLEEAGLELDIAELMTKLVLKDNELRIRTYARKDPDYYAKQKQKYEAILKSVVDTRNQILPSKRIKRK
jgi:hypothetical protein